jgi:hypothetical protein
MADIVLFTKPGLFQRGEDGVISRSFFCQFVSEELIHALGPDSILWVVTRSGNRLSLQSRLKPDLIQRFDEGKMSGWHLISCSASFGGHVNHGEGGPEIPSGLLSVPQNRDGLFLLDETSSAKVASVYHATVRRTGLSLDRDLHRRALKDYIRQNQEELVAMAIDQLEANLRARFFESELAIHATFMADTDVFRSIAKEAFGYLHGVALRDLVTAQPEPSIEARPAQKRLITSVDCSLRQFTEYDFMARTMVWNPENYSPEKEKLGILKTNLAEKRHQMMLRSLVQHLKKNGYSPLGSSSIDLAIEFDSEVHLFEIKSATEDNHKAQALKGCGQVTEYAYFYALQSTKAVRRHLILETPEDAVMDVGTLASISHLLGVQLIEFDFRQPWPTTCCIMDAITSPHKDGRLGV